MGKKYHGMTDQEQQVEVGVFLEVLKSQPLEVQTVALQAVMDLTRWLMANGRVKTFEHAREHARAIYWALVQEKDYQDRRRAEL